MSPLWLVVMHVSMVIVGIIYAAILNIPRVYKKFYPHRTWLTVVIGVLLVGIPWGILWLSGLVSTFDIILYITLFVDVGIPIGIWQHLNGKKLDREEQEIKDRP